MPRPRARSPSRPARRRASPGFACGCAPGGFQLPRPRGRSYGEVSGRLTAPGSVAELGAPAHDELLELGADRIVERWLLVVLERRPPDLARARGGVAGATLGPAVEVLGRGQ